MVGFNLEEFIKKEGADDDSPHSKAYAGAIRQIYARYKTASLGNLKRDLVFAQQAYSGNHYTTARCMVIQALIRYHENE